MVFIVRGVTEVIESAREGHLNEKQGSKVLGGSEEGSGYEVNG